jgi:hypothetical protein
MWGGISHGRARLGEILLRPGESEIVWEIFVQCAKKFELKNCGAIVPPKNSATILYSLERFSAARERGEKENKTGRKRRENKREGRMQRCSDGRPPRVHERAATTAKRRRFQIFLFTQGKVGGRGGGSMGRHCKVHFTLQVQIKFEPESSNPIGASTENSPTSFTL